MTQPTTSPLEQVQDTIRTLSDTDFRTLRLWMADDEVKRREAAPQIEAARAEDTQKLWEAHPDLKPKFETEPVEVETTGTVTLEDLLAKYPPYVQPTGAHDALPTGAIVTDEGRIWRTDLPTLNVWKPGTMNAGWTDITDQLLTQANPAEKEDPDGDTGDQDAGETAPEPEVPPYKQPTGAHDAYNAGDRMKFNGDVYESTINGNVWSPDAYPQGWKKL